jgi:hypothetical protein
MTGRTTTHIAVVVGGSGRRWDGTASLGGSRLPAQTAPCRRTPAAAVVTEVAAAVRRRGGSAPPPPESNPVHPPRAAGAVRHGQAR